MVKEMGEILYKDLTYEVIGSAMEVHKELGPGYVEAVYQRALAKENEIRNIEYDEQVDLDVIYKDMNVGEFRSDFLVEQKVIVEIKAIKELSEIQEAQLINYMKGTGYRVGLVFNFGGKSLEYKRRIV